MRRKWKRTSKGVDEICELCGKACVSKDIGNICVECIEKIPVHIPNEQTIKYLKMKHLKVEIC